MPHQPNLFSAEPDDPRAADASGKDIDLRHNRRLQKHPGNSHPAAWLRRTELLVRVIVRLYLGLLIIALPWMRFWTENGILSYTHGVSLVTQTGFVRGVISGLGLLNVIMAFKELFFPEPGP